MVSHAPEKKPVMLSIRPGKPSSFVIVDHKSENQPLTASQTPLMVSHAFVKNPEMALVMAISFSLVVIFSQISLNVSTAPFHAALIRFHAPMK